jgi:hypothetical protein
MVLHFLALLEVKSYFGTVLCNLKIEFLTAVSQQDAGAVNLL